MSDMIIETKKVVKTVEDWDFTFMSGMQLPVTVDRAAGDSIEDTLEGIRIVLSPKPSLLDETVTLPSEVILIHKQHLAVTQTRFREVVAISPEERLALQQAVHKMAKSVN